MIWLTWRQFRAAGAMMAAALAALAVILAVTGPSLADDYSAGITACTAQGRDCSDFVDGFFRDHRSTGLAVTSVVLVLPALIGIFWGAPLIARELDAGTHRLVWNQSVTRTRWLAVKLGLVGLVAVAVAGPTRSTRPPSPPMTSRESSRCCSAHAASPRWATRRSPSRSA